MSFSATLFLAGRDWLWPAAAAFACAAIFVAATYRRATASRATRLTCAVLKLAGIAALLACLLEPMWARERAKPRANIIAIAADNSRSMTLKDRDAASSRGDELRALLASSESPWRETLAENFELRSFLIDSRLQPTRDFAALDFGGSASALGRTLRQLAERHRGQPLAGIILLTDGVATDLGEADDLRGLPPIYPVVFGGAQTAKDLAISGTTVSESAFEDTPLTVVANVIASGFQSGGVKASLTADADGKPVAEQSLPVSRDGEKLVFRFQFRPEKHGVTFYRLRVSGEGDEATLANNETVITVDRGLGVKRILYVAGRPNWEYKFLRRALDGEEQTQLVGLIRIARREPKFEFRGRAGEAANPLFRGFGDPAKEEAERYDQPVLVRLNTRDEHELRGGFPKTSEELFQYHAVIVDDIEAEFFTPDQMALAQRFVSERGGGFLMLGGAESFRDGHFQRTPIGEMLPLSLEGKAATPASTGVRLTLARDGWLQPWARLRPSEGEEKKRLAALPLLDVMNRGGERKPAASVIANARDGAAEFAALMTQRFGRGRTGALLVGDLWRTGLGDEALAADLARSWRQLVRWLVADVPERVEIRAEPAGDGETVRIKVQARDEKFAPLDNASVAVKVQPPGGEPLTLSTEPSASEPGLFETTYISRRDGGHRVEASVTNEGGASAGMAQTGWSSDLAAAEFRSLAPNRALMESIARQTGGQILAPEELDRFAKDLPSHRVPIRETWTQPLWHTPWMLAFALACFIAEWGVRRMKGLA